MESRKEMSLFEVMLRRRNFFTHKTLQLRFALMASALIFFSTIGAWLLMYWVLRTSVTDHWASSPTGGLEVLHRTNVILCGVVLADALAVFLISISFSHAVAGPLYRIEMGLRELVNTDHARTIALRKYDMLKDTAELVNKVIAKYGKKKS
jgi:hypothetical protein